MIVIMKRIAFITIIIIKIRPVKKQRMILFILLRANQRKLPARNWDGNMERTHVAEEITRMMTGSPRHLRTTLP